MKTDFSTWLVLFTALAVMSTGACMADQQNEDPSTTPATDDVARDDWSVPAITIPGIGDEAAASKPAADPDLTDTITAAYYRFSRLRDEDRNEEATAAALQVAELTQRQYGAGSIKLATPLINLAVMQSITGNLTAAEQNYQVAISIIEQHEGMLSSRLINPLRGLGHTYNRAGMHEKAIENFERALRLNHIELGFTNPEQFGIHDGLTEGYVGLREYEEANFYQEAQLEISQRKFGREDPKTVPAMYKLAEWYRRTGNLDNSTLTYRNADRILREHESETSINRTEALMGLASLYEQQGNRPAATSVLRKGLKVIDSHPEPDKLRRAGLYMALGDMYTRESRSEIAQVEYTSAWADLSSDENFLELRDEYFELPVRLSGGEFPNLARNTRGRTSTELRDGFVMIGYTVDSDGRAQDVKIIESEPPDIMEKPLQTTYRRSMYRPRYVDGAPVATENLLSRHDFRYAEEDRKEDEDKGRLPPPKSGGRIERPGQADTD